MYCEFRRATLLGQHLEGGAAFGDTLESPGEAYDHVILKIVNTTGIASGEARHKTMIGYVSILCSDTSTPPGAKRTITGC